jgi:hypothetical protein
MFYLIEVQREELNKLHSLSLTHPFDFYELNDVIITLFFCVFHQLRFYFSSLGF